MRRLLLVLPCLIVAACTTANTMNPAPVRSVLQTPAISSATPITFPADWVGAIGQADGTREAIIVHLTNDGGTLSIQPQHKALALKDLRRDGATLSFTVTSKSKLRFTGRFDGTRLVGEVEQDTETLPWVLLPFVPNDAHSPADFTGTYRFASGEALAIDRSPTFTQAGLDFFSPGLTLTDFRTGNVRGLYRVADDTFLVGSARVLGYPFGAQITFQRDGGGQVIGLRWQARDDKTGTAGAAQTAARLALPVETVRYASTDGITLTGQLTLPDASGPHPAIVVLHGSEPGTRNDFGRQQWSAFLASEGFAVLTYDKRGVGDSGGVYQERASDSNLQLLAQDALAGVAYLKNRSDIAAQQIGLIGSSQAGWVIPLAAQSDAVAFFVAVSGPVVSVGVEDAYSGYTNDGDLPTRYSPEEISQKLAEMPPSGFDPMPVLAVLKQPGLWLWGDRDMSVPVTESRRNLDDLIARGKSNFAYRVFPNADHNLQQTTQGLFTELPYSSGYPAGFYASLVQWLRHQVKR